MFADLIKSIRNVNDTLQQMQRPLRLADSVLVYCAAAGDYAALDVMSNSVTNNAGRAIRVRNIAREPGATTTIMTVRAFCSTAAVLFRPRLHFFRTMPVAADVEMDDNAAFSIVTALGRDQHVGSILLSAFASRIGVEAESESSNLLEPFRTDDFSRDLWMVLTCEDAETNEAANMTCRFDFYCL